MTAPAGKTALIIGASRRLGCTLAAGTGPGAGR